MAFSQTQHQQYHAHMKTIKKFINNNEMYTNNTLMRHKSGDGVTCLKVMDCLSNSISWK